MASFKLIQRALCLISIFLSLAAAAPHVLNPEIRKRGISDDGSAVSMGSGTYPRATFRADGSILSCFTTFSASNTILTVASSTDGGAAWTVIGSVATEVTQTHDLDNCNVHTLPSGRILAALRNHDQLAEGNSSWYYYRIVISYSDDGGVTWSYLSTPRTSATKGLGLWEPLLMDALDGSLMLYYSYETSTTGDDQDSILITSTDGGVTWSADQTISGANITCRDGMVGVARLGTGSSTLVAVFESLDPDTGIHAITSTDDGATWGDRRVVYASSVSGADQGAPQIAYINGQLVVSFQTNEDTLTTVTADWDVKVVVSTDSGVTWGEKTTVLDTCNWAGELTVDDQHLLVMCGGAGGTMAQTMLVS
ncbi:glycoside hydrolase family 93 protein [Hyaloscypha variabilis]